VQKHTKIYLQYYGYTEADFVACEVCGSKAVDIHHINSRGMGGDPIGKKDVIENLQALCRECHVKYGDDPKYYDFLMEKHLKTLL
jgi:5-methylcytosine-specific restriction endonuclease McrA